MQDEAVLKPIHDAIGIKAIKQFRIIINQTVRKSQVETDLYREDYPWPEPEPEYGKPFDITELLWQKDTGKKDYQILDKLFRCATTSYTERNAGKTLYLDYFIDDDR